MASRRAGLGRALALGLMHGPAELLPISSSGHVSLVPWLLGWEGAAQDPEVRKAFEVALHAGTAAALVVIVRDEVAEAARTADLDAAVVLMLSLLPPVVVGLALERPIERFLGRPGTIAAGLIA
ncbi:MAG: undecaprenyl-diphosphate phosphatase, partial [Acidobacteriota bacterium]|nr:undecaprenyl-diphosphate phosphatase [Acidobacteriota bacterium]